MLRSSIRLLAAPLEAVCRLESSTVSGSVHPLLGSRSRPHAALQQLPVRCGATFRHSTITHPRQALHTFGTSASVSAQQPNASQEAKTDDKASAKDNQHADAKPPLAERLRHIAGIVWREVREAVSPQEELTSPLRAPSVAAAEPGPGATTSELVYQPRTARGWEKQWQDVQEKLSGHPFFKHMRGLKDNTVFQKGQEVAETIRERWETSDSPLVHKIQDMSDSMFTENESARALREIRTRDPEFDMVSFLVRVRADVVTVIQAYLGGDEEVLKQYCSSEMVERLMGIVRAMHAQDLYSEKTILDTSEVELVDLKFLDDQPIVVVQFNCQQINCSRDKFGNVVDGAPDSVHRVYYYWALQQGEAGFQGVDGKFYPPRWVLKEMLVRGMHNLL